MKKTIGLNLFLLSASFLMFTNAAVAQRHSGPQIIERSAPYRAPVVYPAPVQPGRQASPPATPPRVPSTPTTPSEPSSPSSPGYSPYAPPQYPGPNAPLPDTNAYNSYNNPYNPSNPYGYYNYSPHTQGMQNYMNNGPGYRNSGPQRSTKSSSFPSYSNYYSR